MQTTIEIVAAIERSPRILAGGGLAVRRTGRDALHLISTAATPLGGDTIDIRVIVEPGATLWLGSVAATLALPSLADRVSRVRWHLEIGDGGRLTVSPLPTVVAADARHLTEMTVAAAPTAVVHLDEAVQIGRHGETAGTWCGAVAVTVGSRPVLAHRVDLDNRRRGLVSRFRYPDDRPGVVSTTHLAVRMALAGDASLTTALADSVSAASTAADSLIDG
ncbi:urease accessory protein UreD [Williamsia sp. CHRR-6]|uniref:urease accessory protein UreD n=1 Tax=Williamsia sp. CHRR-6 TaxID=2835871 RepID=UPI001BD9D685|nr:urease accessory protein UreD [Williamsia sp. CHRR-6]MBT0568197.1 urease accessory protein UreD [Williamsia sp. CHRR-6]